MPDILLSVFPIFLVAGVGYLLKRRFNVDSLSLTDLSIYLLNPCLTIYALSMRKFDSAMLSTALASIALFAVLILLAEILARVFKLDKGKHLVLDTGSFMMNTGYIGLPIVLLAFGTEAFAHAAVFSTINVIFMFSYGVSRISGKTEGVPEFLKLPLFYSAILAIAISVLGISLPGPLSFSIEWLGKGDILASLLIIGCRLAMIDARQVWEPFVLSLSAFKLFLVPLIALAIAVIFGISGDAFKGFMVQAATPVAINTVVLATKYKNPQVDLYSSVVLVTTVLSILTLSLLVVAI